MIKLISDTKLNLTLGVRLAFFRTINRQDFVVNIDQLFILISLDFLLQLLIGYIFFLPLPQFNPYAVAVFCLNQFGFIFPVYLLTKLWKAADLFLPILVINLSLILLSSVFCQWNIYLQWEGDENAANYTIWAILGAVYFIGVLVRAFFIGSNGSKSLTAAIFIAVISIGIWQNQYLPENQSFWYHSAEADDTAEDQWLEYRNMDAEKLMVDQPRILANSLRALKPQRSNKTELFFIGFAGYATEDVFSKELAVAKNLLDERFDAAGHSINLINHLATRETFPLATQTNLAAALKHIGTVMNKDDDVLFIYLTSHGSKDHKLAVSFWPLPLNEITPEKLRTMLDDAGIKWRVIVISACYSGGFIEALKNDHTLIATASAADKTSFGCGADSEFTYYGEAVFKDELAHGYSLLTAFKQAQAVVAAREKRENREPSLPQLVIGKSISAKLESFSNNLQKSQCARHVLACE